MNKFCDNPKCKHHIDVSDAIFDSGYMYVPSARSPYDKIGRHTLYIDGKRVSLCYTCNYNLSNNSDYSSDNENSKPVDDFKRMIQGAL